MYHGYGVENLIWSETNIINVIMIACLVRKNRIKSDVLCNNFEKGIIAVIRCLEGGDCR